MLKLTPVALILSSILLASFAHADEKNRNVPAFKSINNKGAFNLVIEVGKTQSIVVKGDDKFVSRVVTEVIGDELQVSYRDKNSIKISDNAQVTVSIPELSKFKMEGAGATTINNVTGQRFEVDYEGVGMLTANGKVQMLKLKVQGVGMVDTKGLIAEVADVSVEGVGSVKVYASDRLKASVQGIGSLNYYGNPRSVSKSVEGIGSVRAGD
ncbi:MAG: head GIN domain-containing protein [Undibacterium sp.]|jgi:hypothetical protein|nr:head GIN domain-containing protein [Undibacterium sp.]